MDVTCWMAWFLSCLTRAIEGAQDPLSGVIAKARYWETLREVPLNERQRLSPSHLPFPPPLWRHSGKGTSHGLHGCLEGDTDCPSAGA